MINSVSNVILSDLRDYIKAKTTDLTIWPTYTINGISQISFITKDRRVFVRVNNNVIGVEIVDTQPPYDGYSKVFALADPTMLDNFYKLINTLL